MSLPESAEWWVSFKEFVEHRINAVTTALATEDDPVTLHRCQGTLAALQSVLRWPEHARAEAEERMESDRKVQEALRQWRS